MPEATKTKVVSKHRHLIAITAILALAIIAVAYFANPSTPFINSVKPASKAITYAQYQNKIQNLLHNYPPQKFFNAGFAAQFRTELISMDHLPAQAQPVQLLLALASDNVSLGKIEDSKVIFEELSKKYDWLNLTVKDYLEYK